MKRYFREVTFWKIILLNSIAGFIMSLPLVQAALFWSGAGKEKVLAFFLLFGILAFLFLANYNLWKFSKKQDTLEHSRVLIRLLIILIILIITTGSFFWFPDLWATVVGWFV